jgi:hypothetical protein
MMHIDNKTVVYYDPETNKLRIDREYFNNGKKECHLIEISLDVLEKMTFLEASEFIGCRIILTNPKLKPIYEDFYLN